MSSHTSIEDERPLLSTMFHLPLSPPAINPFLRKQLRRSPPSAARVAGCALRVATVKVVAAPLAILDGWLSQNVPGTDQDAMCHSHRGLLQPTALGRAEEQRLQNTVVPARGGPGALYQDAAHITPCNAIDNTIAVLLNVHTHASELA
ncbi:MAG: hypothetical protein WA324_27500 [Bryobacteraceae bacterium]